MGWGGAPRKYETVEEIIEAISEYFKDCETPEKRDVYCKKRQEVVEIDDYRPMTVEGLAYALGLTRSGLIVYQERKEFQEVIESAKAYIEMKKTELAWKGEVDPRVWQFDMMNNSGYRKEERTEVEVKTATVVPEVPEDIAGMNTSEKEA